MIKNISQLDGDLSEVTKIIVDHIRQVMPKVISVEGLTHFEESFDNQGYTDKNLTKWKRRKFNQKRTTKKGVESAAFRHFKRKDAGRAILVSHQTDTKGPHLKDTLRTKTTDTQVIFATNKEYAQVHNEGGRAGRGRGFIMERRQFMGPSEELNKKINQKLEREINRLLKSL